MPATRPWMTPASAVSDPMRAAHRHDPVGRCGGRRCRAQGSDLMRRRLRFGDVRRLAGAWTARCAEMPGIRRAGEGLYRIVW
ncbi:hypothetical protein BSIN_0264 [Burkholderia singularis]|uniref:Uncharacterized protein n=1 Tax=Burkholderia singularis TaxID=1503053 RepID=A0A238H4A8_9BURK|nr:hypothetical protein BSIN_0264 [Burkholderia singularis]